MDFDWIVDERIAGCEGTHVESDLEYLNNKGIRPLVRLAPEIRIEKTRGEAHGMENCYARQTQMTTGGAKVRFAQLAYKKTDARLWCE